METKKFCWKNFHVIDTPISFGLALTQGMYSSILQLYRHYGLAPPPPSHKLSCMWVEIMMPFSFYISGFDNFTACPLEPKKSSYWQILFVLLKYHFSLCIFFRNAFLCSHRKVDEKNFSRIITVSFCIMSLCGKAAELSGTQSSH